MKLSEKTFNILKNFSNINSGIQFKAESSVLRTISPHKNILAKAVVDDVFPVDFCIYDLGEFLAVVNLHKEDCALAFDNKNAIIYGLSGRSKIKYRGCEPNMIVIPPEKELVLPQPEINITLSDTDFRWISKISNILGSPNISIVSDGNMVSIDTVDVSNDSSHTESLELMYGNGDTYTMMFKTENILKMLPGNYKVDISSKGIGLFTNTDIELEYFITTEIGSVYTSN
jgi:hypothetical protein